MKTIKQLREERLSKIEQMKAIRSAASTENRAVTPEENTRFDNLNNEVTELDAEILRMERMINLEAELNRAPAPGELSRDERNAKIRGALMEYLRKGENHMSAENRQILGEATRAAMGVGSDAIGGYAVPEGFGGRIISAMKAFLGVQEVAFVLPTAQGNDIPFPTNDDTGNTGELIAENTEVAELEPTLGVATLKAYKFSSKLIKVAAELFQDSGVDIEAFLAQIIGERLGRIQNTYMTTGTGTSQPQGFVTGAASASVTPAATALIRDNIVDLIHAVNIAYRKSPSFRLAMNDNTLKAIRKLSIGSGDDRPLYQASPIVGQPDTIEGVQFVICSDMADIGASAKSMVAGDFSRFYIRQVSNIRLLRLDQRYAEYDQIAFVAFARADSRVMDSSAIKYLAHAAV